MLAQHIMRYKPHSPTRALTESATWTRPNLLVLGHAKARVIASQTGALDCDLLSPVIRRETWPEQ